MRLSIPRRFRSLCVHVAAAPATRIGLYGLLAGVFTLTLVQQYIAQAGLSLASAAALTLCLAAAVDLGNRLRGAAAVAGRPQWAYSLVAVWTVLSPWGYDLAFRGMGLLSLEVAASPFVQFLCCAAIAGLLIAGPIAVLVMAAPKSDEEPVPSSTPRAIDARTAWLFGVVVGLLGHAALLAPLAGLHLGGAIVAAMAAGVLLPALMGSPSPADLVTAEESMRKPSARSVTGSVAFALAAVVIGMLSAALVRISQQLSPAVTLLMVGQWGALLAGIAWGWQRTHARTSSFGTPPETTAASLLVMAAAWPAACLLAFPLLETLQLWANARFSFVPLVLVIRCAVAAAFLLPLGVALGGLSVALPSVGASRKDGRGSPAFLPALAFAVGFVTLRWLATRVPSLSGVVVLLCLVLLLAAGGLLLWCRRLPTGRLGRVALLGAVCVVVASLGLHGRYDPARSARLLFATNVLMARAAGLPEAALPVLDEARLIDVREGERGTLTAWKIRGVQVQIRDNGIPKGLASTAPPLGPQYTAELMQAVAPLTLHEAPQRVLILGLSSGVPLTTALEFPVREIVCAETDPSLLDLVATHVWNRAELDPLGDERTRLLAIDPPLAVAAAQPDCDVIISNPDLSALTHASACFTAEFYGRAASCLAEDGIFCQRFQRIDYGPEPLRVAVRSLRTAFRTVGLLEIAPGELLLLGTNSEKGLARPGLDDRLQAPQVRRTLAQVGWDWSVPLNLAAWMGEPLEEFTKDDTTVNTAANGRFSFGLPAEMMRWGPKWQEVQTAMAPLSGRFVETAAVDRTDPDLLRRLAEVTGRRKLMTEFPDQPWAYRKSLREQLVERPRTVVQQVAGSLERVLHPDDERRKHYFETLAVALREAESDVTTVDALSDFLSPYDPLLSYFIHHEAAELYHRAGSAHARAELAHRLHMAYYADPADRSIRNLAKSIELIVASEDALPHPADRWDHLNALLQLLKVRWELRGTAPPANASVVLNDVDHTLAALDAGLAEMKTLTADAGVTLESWEARRDLFERTLDRPLRTYRTRLLAHHLKSKRKARAADAASDDGADSETGLDPDAILRSMSEF